MARGVGYPVLSLFLGLVIALSLSTAANAHGRANDGHHHRAKLASLPATTAKTVSDLRLSREPLQRDAVRELSAAGSLARSDLPPGSDRNAVPAEEVASDAVAARAGDRRDFRIAALLTERRISAEAHLSARGIGFVIATTGLHRSACCCVDGQGCCCGVGSACSSCGMNCCTGVMATARNSCEAIDRGAQLHSFQAIKLSGIGVAPAERPPAVRI